MAEEDEIQANINSVQHWKNTAGTNLNLIWHFGRHSPNSTGHRMLEAWSNEQTEFIKEEAQFLIYLDCWQIVEKITQSMVHPRTILMLYYHSCSKRETGYFSDRKYSFSQHTNSDNLWPAKQLDFLTLPYLSW